MESKEQIINIPKTSVWDVDEFDLKIGFLHDCRVYNGGQVAPPEIRKFWKDDASDLKEGSDIIAS